MDPTQSAPSYVISSYCKVMKVFHDVEFVFSEINKINDINCFTVESRLCELGYDSCDFRIFAVWARILGFSKVFQELSAKKTFDKIGACFL